MAKKPKFYLPSGGGLVRYSDEYKSKFELSPKAVMILIAIIVILELILHLTFKK
ncbi:MAG: preprotein translocase subunit Sec61beta [Candidatus Woesearchaeota archaeon]